MINQSEARLIITWFHSLRDTHINYLVIEDYELYFKLCSLYENLVSESEILDYNRLLKNGNKCRRMPSVLTEEIINNIQLYNRLNKVKYNGYNEPLTIISKGRENDSIPM
jgi:hypothetical protein